LLARNAAQCLQLRTKRCNLLFHRGQLRGDDCARRALSVAYGRVDVSGPADRAGDSSWTLWPNFSGIAFLASLPLVPGLASLALLSAAAGFALLAALALLPAGPCNSCGSWHCARIPLLAFFTAGAGFAAFAYWTWDIRHARLSALTPVAFHSLGASRAGRACLAAIAAVSAFAALTLRAFTRNDPRGTSA
jgi:hypothetical protein